MKNFLNTYKLALLGIIIGAIAGYFYWKYVGCLTGTCPITSSPVKMSLFGAAIGGLLFDIFRKSKK